MSESLTEFLLARIAEDEANAQRKAGIALAINSPERPVQPSGLKAFSPFRVLAECEAKRRIVELHESWPVLVETPPTFDMGDRTLGADSVTFRASQQIAWMTTQEYRARFGDEPPTGPILRALALPYAEHPDYDEEWKP